MKTSPKALRDLVDEWACCNSEDNLDVGSRMAETIDALANEKELQANRELLIFDLCIERCRKTKSNHVRLGNLGKAMAAESLASALTELKKQHQEDSQ